MHPPPQVKLYVHNAKVPRAYQLSFLHKGKAPNCYGFYTYLAYINQEHNPTPKTQAHVKSNLRMLRSTYPL